MSSLLKEEMQRVLFKPEKHRLVDFIEIEEKKRGRHFLCVSESKSNEIQIAVVKCQKVLRTGRKPRCVGLEDNYVITEVWALQELRVLDGRDPDITTVIEKAQQRLQMVLRKHNLDSSLLLTFYHLSIKRLLTYCITVWYGSCTVADRERLQIDDPCFLMHFDSVRPVTAVSCAAKYSLARCLVGLSETHQHAELSLLNFDWTYVQPTSIYSNRGDCMVLMRICFYAFNLVCLSLCPMP